MDNNININNQNSEWFESPLLFFENLIYYKHFYSLKSNFTYVSEEEATYDNTHYDEETETKISFGYDNETGDEYKTERKFSDFLIEILTREGLNSLKKINEIFLNLRQKDHKKEFLESILSDIGFLLSVLSRYEDAKKYNVIDKRLKSIENHILVRHTRILGTKKIELEKEPLLTIQSPWNQEEIRNDVVDGRLELAYSKLKQYFETDNDLRNECLLCMSRLKEYNKTLVNFDHNDKEEINKLRSNALNLIDKMN